MPLFFFDVYDGERSVRDDHGIELASVEEAAEQAAALLPDMARDAGPARESRDFATFVRDEDEAVVYRAALLYRGERMGAPHVRAAVCASEAQALILQSRELRAAARDLSERLRENVSDLMAAIQRSFPSREQTEAEREARS